MLLRNRPGLTAQPALVIGHAAICGQRADYPITSQTLILVNYAKTVEELLTGFYTHYQRQTGSRSSVRQTYRHPVPLLVHKALLGLLDGR